MGVLKEYYPAHKVGSIIGLLFRIADAPEETSVKVAKTKEKGPILCWNRSLFNTSKYCYSLIFFEAFPPF